MYCKVRILSLFSQQLIQLRHKRVDILELAVHRRKADVRQVLRETGTEQQKAQQDMRADV